MKHFNDNRLFNKSIIALSTLMAFSCFSTNAKELDFSKTQKEIKIMSTIFETALAEKNIAKSQFFNTKKVQATYLAEQGMLFSFNFSKNMFIDQSEWAEFGQGLGQFVGEIASEVGTALSEANLSNVPRVPNINFDFEENLQEYENQREELESLREQQQEQREQVRELQREIREIQRNQDNSESENKKSQQLKNDLEQKLAKLNQKMEQYNQSMAEYRAKKEKKHTESTKLKSDTIMTTLCDYGATLRSLKDNEHITIIFNNFNDEKDQVYVFDIKDVRSCESKDKLVRSAISYLL